MTECLSSHAVAPASASGSLDEPKHIAAVRAGRNGFEEAAGHGDSVHIIKMPKSRVIKAVKR